MKRKNALTVGVLAAILAAGCLSACSDKASDEDFNKRPNDTNPDDTGGNGTDDGSIPDFDQLISAWEGETADDKSLDIVGTDKDIYHELNSFSNTVTVVYNGAEATVACSNPQILTDVQGAYVTIDMQTNSVAGAEIVLMGTSDDGGLKIYGSNKFKLTLSGVELTSKRGPAINSQCKKRIYVHLNDGTTNRLTDAASYGDDTYYTNGANSSSEDRKGCFFSEGNLVFSGAGVMVVAGRYKHGIATDGYMWIRPGVTLVVTSAAKNAIHAKGDTDDGIGVYMAGGLIYADVSSTAGKGIKTDSNAEIAGGKLTLCTAGNAEYDSDDNDTSSAAGIKADGDVVISGGTHVLKSTGTGGKGINADGAIRITGGTVTVTTTGGKYTYSSAFTSSPKGVKADGDIEIGGGKLSVCVTGASDGSEGIESKSSIYVSGGEIYSYAYDDAINAADAICISGGKVYAYASNNDGIDTNGSLTITGGLVIGAGSNAPESGIDVDNSKDFKINGGTVIGVGGTVQSNPSSASQQRSVIYNGISASKGTSICILNSSGEPIMAYELPRTLNGGSMLFSSKDLTAGSYTVCVGGTLSGAANSWNGWSEGGSWSGGSQLGTFTSSGIVTTVGSNHNFGPGGGHGGGGGGRP